MSDLVYKPKNAIEEVLVERLDRLRELAPPDYKVIRAIQIIGRVCYQNQALLRCDKQTILLSVCHGMELGLDFSPGSGQAYIVPYGAQAQLIVGYRGWKKLVLDSGFLAGLDAQVIYEGEPHEIILGTDPRVTHTANFNPAGKPIGAYAIAVFKDGHKQVAALRKDDIARAKSASRARSGPWTTDEAAMIRKTALLRLVKYLPETPAVVKAMEYDEPEVTVTVQPERGGSLREALNPTPAPAEPQPPENNGDGEAFIESLDL